LALDGVQFSLTNTPQVKTTVIGRFKTSHLWAVQNQPPEVGLVHIWLTVFFKSKFRFL
jgi:hypothetical protein